MNDQCFWQTMYNHLFEKSVCDIYLQKLIYCPVYLSLGTEHVAAIIAHIIEQTNKKWLIFPQHRCHSYVLSFSKNAAAPLIAKELLGLPNGMNNGMQGSASLAYDNVYGHSGLLGDQIPIATGAAQFSNNPVVCVLGDAAAEEDYALSSFGYAATHKVPILYLVEDNNLSLLTEKSVRRSWDIVKVAKSFGLNATHSIDDPYHLFDTLKYFVNIEKLPALVNIHVCRHNWHAGVGVDGPPAWNRLQTWAQEMKACTSNFDQKYTQLKESIQQIWQPLLKQLKK